MEVRMFNHSKVRKSWRAAALTVALPLMLASPAAASAGQQAADNAPLSQAVVLSEPFDADCGLLPPHCTIRLNREMTRRARDAAQVGGPIAAAACTRVPVPLVAGVCAAAVAAGSQLLATFASNYYEDGDCLGIKVAAVPTPAVAPTRVKRGDHNCS
jgi:hypothetical protein